jgi:outer membrane protein assembly factor BamD
MSPIMSNSQSVSRSVRLIMLCLVAITLMAGCGRDRLDDERSAEDLYAEARSAMAARNYDRAIRLYRSLTVRYPFGRHAEQAQLDMAYAQHRARQPEAALTTLDRFIRTYPTHPNVDYAWYLKGLVHYDQAMGFIRRILPGQIVDRDQDSARRAFMDFQELIQRYPDSRYVADARQRMVFLRNAMAEHEIVIGEYYYTRQAYIAALNRAKYVIENYPGAPANIDALELMERAYLRLDLDELASDTRRTLEYNYSDELANRAEQRDGFLRRLWPF